jgi:hypothetical protein
MDDDDEVEVSGQMALVAGRGFTVLLIHSRRNDESHESNNCTSEVCHIT